MDFEAIIGQMMRSVGSSGKLRLTKTSALATSDTHARYMEAVLQGQVYTIQAKSVTVTATTDISPLPATTGRVGVGVYNPPGSGVNLVLWKIIIASVSGTPGGPAYLDVLNGPAGALPTNAVQAINNLYQTKGGHKAYAYSAAVPAQPTVATMLKPIQGSPAAIALGAGIYSIEDLIDGAVVIAEGGLAGLTWHAAGTSHVYSAALIWEEVQHL